MFTLPKVELINHVVLGMVLPPELGLVPPPRLGMLIPDIVLVVCVGEDDPDYEVLG